MKHQLTISTLLLLALFSALAPPAFASTTWYVNGVSGSDGNSCKSPTTACKTIGHAIALAHSGDTVMVAAATYFEHLTIGISLNVLGAATGTTILDGGGNGRVVIILRIPTITVVLSRLTIRNGRAIAGPLGGGGFGGGIYNYGTLTINSSTISGNVATWGCITRPVFCFGGFGGGIYSEGTLIINNSTVSGNVAQTPSRCVYACDPGNGGGIGNNGTLIISNSTISGNSAPGVVFRPPTGGGIKGSATLQNSIVANNYGGNCSGTMTSKGYNMSSDGTCNFSNSGDRNNVTNSMLGTLGNYGGPTQTIPLLSGSPAIDGGNPSGCTDGNGHLLTTDQRGYPRPNTEDIEDKKGCDMGAYERQSD